MNHRKYAYLFVIGGEIQWSSETQHTLPIRADNQNDANLIHDFMEEDCPGSFIKLSTGEFVFQIS